MAPLPRDRVVSTAPFNVAGVDYAGPVSLTASRGRGRGRGRRAFKGYIAVFVCFTTRAVHLELVGDYTASAFLAALHRFAARRGTPSTLWSDQGTTFLGASLELRTNLSDVLRQGGPVAQALVNDGTEWKFIPPSAPHFGGLWEAKVRSVKHHLRRVIGDRPLSFEEFSTWLARVEACLNSRPLCPLTDDPDDLGALTPGHFLIGRPLNAIPEPSTEGVRPSTLSRWQLLQSMTEHLWARWSKEYLSQLQARRKWASPEDPPRVGELVVIIDARFPPSKWALGRILELFAGPNGQTRVARVRTQESVLTRPLVKLVRLPTGEAVATPDTPALS
ncbi:uncharacterized protein LOC116849241 [Odontomachus brunneus]|uniref:uncharacterized protein LOC116849241 n=1 Tax=Odontomachus brunneus TaxID=486640 RepID=UPI0013F1A670|nr:uncharacterized protein LOC116849241 [Odontomachus brunneus]